jgi:hypothetical protein
MFIKEQNLLRVILFLILSPFLLAGCFENVPEGMVYIPSGEFTIGTNEEDQKNHALSLGLDKPWYADESPERRTDISAFYIDRYEVTNSQYYIFCQATDHKPPKNWRGQKFPEGKDNLPVTSVFSMLRLMLFGQANVCPMRWNGKRPHEDALDLFTLGETNLNLELLTWLPLQETKRGKG